MKQTRWALGTGALWEDWGQFHQGVWLSAQSNCDELWVPGNSLTVSPADPAMKNDMDKMFFPFSPMFVFSLPLPENDIL